ncbi:MAG: hypothetical protein ACQETD_00555 [Pseudomonadota bacterium]
MPVASPTRMIISAALVALALPLPAAELGAEEAALPPPPGPYISSRPYLASADATPAPYAPTATRPGFGGSANPPMEPRYNPSEAPRSPYPLPTQGFYPAPNAAPQGYPPEVQPQRGWRW